LVGAFVIILRMPPFLGVSPLFGIVGHTSSSGGAAVVVTEGLAVVVTAVVVVAAVVVAAGAVVFGGVVVAWVQLMMTKENIITIARII
jgi:phage-related minor tail protein